MKKRVCLSILIFMLGGITGCEKMEHGPALNLPEESSQVWVTQVYAEVESTVQEIEAVKSDTDQVMEEAYNAVEEAKRLIEELEQNAERPLGELITSQGTALPETEVSVSGGEEAEPLIPIYEFTYSEREYFEDALFIGDSRTKGLQLYGTFDNADYFAEPGLSLYTLTSAKLEVGEYGKIKLEELLEKEQYGKIYLMLGINELGYKFDTTLEKYQDLVSRIRQMQPEAILYVCANLHVTETRDEHDEIHNNTNINKINTHIATMADEQDIFYLDVNVLFDDEEGNLDREIASDDSHVRVTAYEEWCNWLKENTIVK